MDLRLRALGPPACFLALAWLILFSAFPAGAATQPPTTQAPTLPAPIGQSSNGKPKTPVSATEAIAIARRDPVAVREQSRHPGLSPRARQIDERWEVSFYDGEEKRVLVIVDPRTGSVKEAWSGYQVSWQMARGYPGAFGRKLNAPYVFIPLLALFLIGLVDWRRPWRLVHLDLLVLVAFAASHYYFNRAEIGVSVPLIYPPLIYLAGRMLWNLLAILTSNLARLVALAMVGQVGGAATLGNVQTVVSTANLAAMAGPTSVGSAAGRYLPVAGAHGGPVARRLLR